jgi:hypothetical protein
MARQIYCPPPAWTASCLTDNHSNYRQSARSLCCIAPCFIIRAIRKEHSVKNDLRWRRIKKHLVVFTALVAAVYSYYLVTTLFQLSLAARIGVTGA